MFGFTRRHLGPRIADTLFHRNVFISLLSSALITFLVFRWKLLPSLESLPASDVAIGMLAFAALGFGASASATVLVLSIPRTTLYLTMVVNGKGAPRTRIKDDRSIEVLDDVRDPMPNYGYEFRSLYGDLVFVFLWTMIAQLLLAVVAVIYLACTGAAPVVNRTSCRPSSICLFLLGTAIIYSVLQMGSLIRGMADYARQQELYERLSLGLLEGAKGD